VRAEVAVPRSSSKKPEALDFDYFSSDLFANFNSGAAELAMEAKNRTESYARSRWSWWRIGLGVLIGTVFAFVNLYNALLVGVVVGGSWYLSYFLGMALRWRPNDINLAAGASTGASQVVIGFAFTYPALFLLSDYAGDGTIGNADLPPVWFLAACALLSGLLGIGYFLVWRRLWVVERPLPYPGFETSMELLAIANARGAQAVAHAQRTVRNVLVSTGAFALFVFMRDWAIGGRAPLDRLVGSRVYGGGDLSLPVTTNHFPTGLLYLSPLLAATGWFIGLRVAVAFFLGSAFAFWFLAPFAVEFGVVPATLGAPIDFWGTAKAFLLDILGAGVIAGAGLLVLWRHREHFVGAFRDLAKARLRREAKPAGGWYELPTSWLQVFRRFDRAVARAGLRIRVRLLPLEELPESFEVLVVAPQLQQRAEALRTGARLVCTTRELAPVAVDELLRELEGGVSIHAERAQPDEPRIVIHRGSDVQ
jgi:hypothetical protein